MKRIALRKLYTRARVVYQSSVINESIRTPDTMALVQSTCRTIHELPEYICLSKLVKACAHRDPIDEVEDDIGPEAVLLERCHLLYLYCERKSAPIFNVSWKFFALTDKNPWPSFNNAFLPRPWHRETFSWLPLLSSSILIISIVQGFQFVVVVT